MTPATDAAVIPDIRVSPFAMPSRDARSARTMNQTIGGVHAADSTVKRAMPAIEPRMSRE
jgi:hypothetical protein